jgi:hypothetical protein
VKELSEVAGFVKDHPKEIIILDFQHFFGLTPSDHIRFSRNLEYTFQGKLVKRPKPGSDLPTVNELWSNKKQVVVLYSDESSGSAAIHDNRYLWQRKSFIRSYWCQTFDINDLRGCLQAEVNGPQSQSLLFVLQGVLTPNIWTTAQSVIPFIGGMHSLRDSAASSNNTICSWFIGPWVAKKLNILMVDWIEFGDVVGKAIEINQK